MKIGGEKAYDRAREDMQKRKEEAEERRARREAMRVDYQVSGVSFNSTVGGKENEAEKAEEKAGTGSSSFIASATRLFQPESNVLISSRK